MDFTSDDRTNIRDTMTIYLNNLFPINRGNWSIELDYIGLTGAG
jgi:hypothetical protein